MHILYIHVDCLSNQSDVIHNRLYERITCQGHMYVALKQLVAAFYVYSMEHPKQGPVAG